MVVLKRFFFIWEKNKVLASHIRQVVILYSNNCMKFAWMNSALAVWNKCSSYRGGHLNRFAYINKLKFSGLWYLIYCNNLANSYQTLRWVMSKPHKFCTTWCGMKQLWLIYYCFTLSGRYNPMYTLPNSPGIFLIFLKIFLKVSFLLILNNSVILFLYFLYELFLIIFIACFLF